MSKISKLLGATKLVKIGEEEIEMKPLTISDLDIVNESQSPEKAPKAIKEMIRRTLKRSIPDATDEEIENIGMGYFEDLVNAIFEVNGLEKVEAKKKEASSDTQTDTQSPTSTP